MREHGFYWVRWYERWEVAEFLPEEDGHDDGYWLKLGEECEGRPEEIDERRIVREEPK